MFPPHEGIVPAPERARREFSDHERALLLTIAHRSIENALNQQPLVLDSPSEHLAQPRGVFTTLYVHQQLRGCVGYFEAVKPLYITVAETARGAAFSDSRFHPVSLGEISELAISLSILSPLRPIRPEEIEVGVHGLVVTRGAYRGLLLPQVAVEHNWDRIAFLQQTCRKAGLPSDAWVHGASFQAFTAEVFGDAGCAK
jgi:AmmeMemoRadiSam system protein A